jgi:hypothetical protein
VQGPFPVPPHCRVTQLRLEADTEEAFDKACEQFAASEKILTVGPIATNETSGYTFRFVDLEVEGTKLEIEGPRKKLKITVADA